jgi:hypothetical protein
MAKAKSSVPDGYHTLTPSLMMENAAQTIEWYTKALGAEEMSGYVWWIATHTEDLSKEELHRRADEFFKKQPQHVAG